MNKKKWISLFILFSSVIAQAQVDPSDLITNDVGSSTSTAPNPDESSGRYIRRPHLKHKRIPASADQTASPTPAPTPLLVPPAEPPTAPGATRLTPAPMPQPTPAASASPSPSPTPQNNQAVSSPVRDFVLGGDVDLIEGYKSFLNAQDIRKNIFELSISTGYLYNTSSSTYYFRNYNDVAPTLDVGADIWLTPFFGIDADYRQTLLNSISDSPTQNNSVSTSQTWMDLGIKFRRFFGMNSNATSLAFGLKYISYDLNVPASSVSRAKELTQGPELSLDLSVPASKNYFWNFGLLLEPFLSHTETSNPSVQSGKSNQTLGVGANAGGEYRLSRATRVFFKLSALVYNSSFSGVAQGTDPVTGQIPNNVSVSNAFYMFDLGIRFGK